MTGNALDTAGVRIAESAVSAALRRDRPLRDFLHRLSTTVAVAGGEAYLAGGYLRDVAGGHRGADVDVMVAGLDFRRLGKALSRLPQVELGIRKVIRAGRHFPVYRVATTWADRYVDVSAARSGESSARGNPLERALQDASRRDFTVNGLLYRIVPGRRGLSGSLLDPCGGIRDLRRRTIRFVGDPEERLREDPLRALRAIRMKNEGKGYRIDPGTFRAIRRLGPELLPDVPADRVTPELLRSLAGDPIGTIEDLRRTGILRHLLPGLSRRRGAVRRTAIRYRLLEHTVHPIPPAYLLANLLVELPSPEAEDAARRLRFPDVREIVRALSDLHKLLRPGTMRYPMAETEEILLRRRPPEPFLALHKAVTSCGGQPAGDLKRFFGFCKKVPVLLKGSDLKLLGIPEGPGRREALLSVREATLRRRLRTRREAMEFVRNGGPACPIGNILFPRGSGKEDAAR